MKHRCFMRRGIAALLAACLAAVPGLCPTPVLAEDANAVNTSQAQDISKGSAIDGTDYSVTSAKTYAIAPDITERTIVTNNAAGTSQTVANVMEINTANGNAKLAASYGNIDPAKDGWKMSTLTDQTHLYEKTYGENAVGGINASLFNITTGEPMGYLRMRGTTYKDDAKIPFVAVFSDGSVGIYPAGTTLDQAADEQSQKVGSTVTVTDAAGGWCILVDGDTVATQGSNGGYYSRSAIGLKADGTIVMLQADGTMPPRSLGYTLEEMGRVMKSLGCTYALELDEGGSSEFVSQREGETDIAMRNTPAGGGERVISTSLLVVSTAASSGEFDHASITPNDNIFTPNTTVSLTATGMDYSGAAAKNMPADVSWSLTDDSKKLGELRTGDVSGDTASAEFVSNGECGTATVQLMYKGKIVGETNVRIQNPDSLYFVSDEVNLNYEEKSDLGLTALYQQEPVVLKDGDISWTIEDTKAGSFEGNTFVTTSDVTVSTSPKVTASYGSLSATTTINVGKQPTIVLDGGDDDGHDYSTIGNTVHSFDGMDASAVATYSYPGRGGVVTGSVVSDTDADYADIIRFGHKAIKLDFDWTGITGTDGACLGLGSNIDVPGTPTALGAWVYIPEGAPVPWLRAQIATSKDGTTYTNAYINFTDQNSNGKDAKYGWNYFEADMTQYAGQKIRINSGMLFRAMVTKSGIGWYTADGSKLSNDQLKGYILVDNISFVYGANNQDTKAPRVKSLQVINDDGTKSDLEEDSKLGTNAPAFYVTYDDNEDTDKFATGVESAYFYLDGTYYGTGDKDNLGSTLKDVHIPNGQHSITFYLKDGFGNVTRETRYFTIEGEDSQYTGIDFAADGEPVVGKDWKLHLTTNNIADVSTMTAVVQLSRGYSPTVEFSSGVTGTYQYADTTGKLTIDISKVENASGDELATITVPVPESSVEGSEISVQVISGTYKVNTAASDGGAYWMGFSTPTETHKVTAAYVLETDAMVVGLPATVIVKDAEGNAAANVDVYADGSTNLGKTDADGRLTTSDLTKAEGAHTLYAEDSQGNRSFAYSVTAYKSTEDDAGKEGLPQYVHFNVSKDPTTQKNISWYSSPTASAGSAQVRVATSEDMQDASVVNGSSQLGSYTQSGVVSRINYANLTGLEAGKTYYFQVGDGQKWSDVSSFTTAAYKNSEKIFLTADIQEDDALTGFGRIASHIKDGGYDLGIQLGDAVDNVRYYNQWTDALKLFALDGVGDKDMLHVVGNHEADDDGNGSALAKETFNLAGDWYSVEYGDVYIAVLNFTSDQAKLNQFKEWLVQDASASNCNWKILVTHIPVYYTNPTGGGEEYLAELPDAVEKAGIDFYFAGNDHSYARTEPLTQGKVDKDDGVVYYICGTTGGKSYSVVNNPDFHFDIATLDFNSVYVSFETSGDKATVTAYNVDTNGNQSVLDTYTKTKTCANDDHSYVYDKDSKKLVCTKCGHEIDPAAEKYNGFVQEKQSGKTMCFVSGELVKSSMRFGNSFYFADDNGYAYDGEYTIDGTVCTFKGGYFESSADRDVLAAGRTGDKVDFILRKDGTLKLTGVGDMYSYYRESFVPWSPYQSSIKELDVAAGVTSLSDWALYKCSSLSKVVFADGSKLASVGMNAFDNCSSLASVELPSGVTSISWNAFAHCGALTDLYLPDGVAWIGGGSGYDFTKESTVTLSVARGTYAEQWAKDHNVRYTSREPAAIASGTCGDGLTWKLSGDGVLSIDGEGAMASYASESDVPWSQYRGSIKELDVAAGVTSLSDWALYKCSSLSKVVFADGSKLASVGMNAFDNCSSLASVELPSGVTSISWNAFAHCGALTDLYLPDGVAWIGGGSGYDFTKESTVTLSVARGTYAEQWAKDHNVRYTLREPAAIASGTCGDGLTWKLSGDGVLSIDGEGAMASYASESDVPWSQYQSSIKELDVAAGVTSLSDWALYKCSSLSKVVFADGSKLASVGMNAFDNCSSLASVELPSGVTSISWNAFAHCGALTDLYLPDGVAWIGGGSGYDFTKESTVTLSVARGTYAEQWAKDHNVRYTSREPAAIASGTCGDGLTWKLSGDGVLSIDGEGAMASYASESDVPWSQYRGSIKELDVAAGVTSLSDWALYKCSSLSKVVFADGSKLASVGMNAFDNCSSLASVELPSGVTSISWNAFAHCGALTDLYLPDGVAWIGGGSGYDFTKESTVTLSVARGTYAEQWAKDHNVRYTLREPAAIASGTCGDGLTWKLSGDGVLSIDGEGAMASYASESDVPWSQYQSSIKELDVAAGVTSLSDWALYKCSSLSKVVFADGSKLASVGMNAFDNCSSLASVELPSGVTSISWNAFAHCGALTDLYLPDGVAWIGGGSGYDFTKESTVTLSVARGTYAEQWAKDHNVRYTSREPQAIASLETTSSAQSMEEKLNASEDVAAETSSTDMVATDSASSDPGTVEDEGNASAEEGNAEQESADLQAAAKQGSCGEALTWSLDDDGTLTIDGDGKMTDYSEKSSAPWDELAQDIVSIHVGAKVETIGAYAFSGLEKVESVTFDDESELTEIRDFAFSGCKALKTVELPKKLEKIGQGAFEKCEKLELVKLQESVTSIGEVLVEQDTDQAANEQQPVDAFADSLLVKIEAPEDSYALQYAEEHKLV